MTRLSNKIALVTGAAGDIGAAIARKFIAESAVVCVADLDSGTGQVIADNLGDNVFFEQMDVTKEDDWHRVIDSVIGRHQRLDVLVNNAGTLETGTIEDTDLALWRRIQDTNATGTFLGCQAAIQTMKQTGGGAIINMHYVDAHSRERS